MEKQILKPFYQIIETPYGPVLAYKWHDEADKKGAHQIIIAAVAEDGTQISSTIKAKTEAIQDQLWADADNEAIKAIKTLLKLNAKAETEVSNGR